MKAAKFKEDALAKNLKLFRKKKNWSQTELAKNAGTTLTHINRLETGKSNPSIEIVQKIALALEVSIDDLVSQNDNSKEIKFENQAFYEKIKLLDTFSEEERNAVNIVIDSILTKKKMLNLLKEHGG
ncbi:DNA-binding helix-turn-helix protein [Leptospira interrogans str. 2003000735]|uniref:DNA-binding helix-turn-helix protein n=1 Tax=Leptospira interrogans str. 2002000626 TaxID=996803 RepID=A0A829D7H3_LEPIR|nr:helix-turn-helix transcriptional regulator [Leptospira interrogans]EMY06417.1 DNA-binding helix-turn-helix protein [Leptospira interrogans str. 2002000626]EKN87868.1 DNA-binding helix-turn-helix protein [Leptospira interrogans str. 2002000624]EKQ37665.1 DNA-binding helix-turn-helix protein [Leptospira interrogans str. 2002000621]EKQ46382.1 DNA-binding helix-turn-helix protein [Leptospira interrogans str. 2002000623]EMJ67868.1 DNA-binding helix-turn-helix protein [Leptospira interrogans str.